MAQSENNTDVINRTWQRYNYLRDNGHTTFVEKASRCEDFFEGRQWDPTDLANLKASRRPAVTVNKIISTLSNVMGEQIFNRTDISFKPRNEGATSEIADALTKVFMQISDNNDLPWVRSDVFADGIISSRGFYDVRLDFSDSVHGEVRVTQLNPKNVLIDSDAEGYDPDSWNDVIITKWMSVDQIESLYGKKVADKIRLDMGSVNGDNNTAQDDSRDRFGTAKSTFSPAGMDPDTSVARSVRVIERQHRVLTKLDMFIDRATGDIRHVPDGWDEVRIAEHLEQNPHLEVTKRPGTRIRWTVVAGNEVLHDTWSPYRHFTVVPYFPHFRRGRTVGLVENLIGPQELLNKVRSQELHVINTSANSGWVVKQNALKNMSLGELEQRGAQTGLVLEVDELNSIDKITPNQVPTGLDRVSYKSEEDIKSISGVSDYMSGFAREDVAAKSVQANQQSGQANLAKVMDNLNRTDHMLARTILAMVQEYYTEERMIYITSDRITNRVEEMVINQVTPEGQIINDLTLGEYAIVVTNQPERDTFEENQLDQMIAMRQELGIQIPDSYLIQASRLRDKAEIIEALEGNQDSPEAQAQAELQMRVAEADAAIREADAMKKQAEAELTQARAQKEVVQFQLETLKLQNGGVEPGDAMDNPMAELEAEMIKFEAEMQLKREQFQAELALKREQMMAEIALKQQQAQQDADIKQQAAQHKALTDRAAAQEKAKQAAAQPAAKQPDAKEPSK